MTRMHFTFREIPARLTDPRALAIFAAATLFCVIAGPFGTLAMPAPVRAAYWIVANAVAMVMSTTIIFAAFEAPRLQRFPRIARGLIGALAFSVLFAAMMAIAGDLVFPGIASFPGFLQMLGYVTPVAASITVIVHLFVSRAEAADAAALDRPRILKRLKPGLEARLLRMAMQDHYVEVFTTRGSQLILMRFADALDEVDGEPGWRVHRSHWVAEAAMKNLKRADGKLLVETEDGALVPISRTYAPALRDAGVLKRF